MDKPKQISFQDGGHNLCLRLTSISSGWASKIPEQYQVRIAAKLDFFYDSDSWQTNGQSASPPNSNRNILA